MQEAEGPRKQAASESGGKVWWLWFATTLSVVYISTIVLSLPYTARCAEFAEQGLLLELFGCRSVNEVGDFLAGAFAPIAFLWLVTAVLIQSQELKAQRRELQLTRLEFAENRKVAQAQVREAERQAEFIGHQVEVARQQFERQKQEWYDRAFRARRTAFVRWLKAGALQHIGFMEENQPTIQEFAMNLPDDEDIVIFVLTARIRQIKTYLEEKLGRGTKIHPQLEDSQWPEFLNNLHSLYQSSCFATPEIKEYAEEVGLKNAIETMTDLLSRAKPRPD